LRRMSAVQIDVVEASATEKEVLRQLLELYRYDFSEIDGSDVDTSGRYGYHYLDRYWIEPGRHPFLVQVDGRWAGFALVMRRPAVLFDGEVTWMAEFFVMRKYRRRGVGEYVATQLFDRFPGRWEVGQMTENTAAQAFWRTVIGRYTAGRYQEIDLDDDRWQGPVQTFQAPRAIGSARSNLPNT
jgi:predicted acetyltransferase